MMKDVIIDIKTYQSLDDQSDTIEFSTDGRFGIKDGQYYICYDESGLLDVEGEIKTTLYVKSDNTVILQRKGSYNSRMVIEKGVRTNCFYSTPVGNLTLGIFGEKVFSNLNENGGDIALTYIIDAEAKLLSRNKVNISIREVN